MVARPAFNGVQPVTTWSWRTRKNSIAPSAPYTSRVSRLVTENVRDAKRCIGTSASG